MVVNLAAGLDARPYRMALPPASPWIEVVDLPALLDYKEEILRGEKPACAVERVRLDLADVPARRELFRQLGERAKKALVITEGLLQREIGSTLDRAGAPLKFTPLEGPGFFAHHGWRVRDVESPLREGARAKRLSLMLRLIALLPDSAGPKGSRPWSGICLLERQASPGSPEG